MECCAFKKEENTLFSKDVGQSFETIGFGPDLGDKYLRRLLEIGLTIGTSIRLIRKSIRGKTILIEVRGVVYSIQKEIAVQIIVKKV